MHQLNAIINQQSIPLSPYFPMVSHAFLSYLIGGTTNSCGFRIPQIHRFAMALPAASASLQIRKALSIHRPAVMMSVCKKMTLDATMSQVISPVQRDITDVCMNVCMYVCLSVRMYVNVYVYVCVCLCVCVRICIRIIVYLYTCIIV